MSNTSKLSDQRLDLVAQLQESIVLQITTQLEELRRVNEARDKMDINVLKMNEIDLIIQAQNLSSSLKRVKRKLREAQRRQSSLASIILLKMKNHFNVEH
jgi:vacuolar-type H+-ATPase subunit I/STV1